MGVWEEVLISDVCKTGAGGTPSKTNSAYYDGGTIPWIMSGEVAQGNIYSSLNYITEKGLANSSAKIFPINTILVAMYGATAGQIGILRFEAATNQAVCGVQASSKIFYKFLYYAIHAKQKSLIKQAVGNAQPNISQAKIRNLKIPLPSLPEQQAIVNILDDAFARIDTAIANTKQNMANAKELFDSYLNSVFEQKGDGWEEKSLQEICTIVSKLVDPREAPFLDMPHIGAGNIHSKSKTLIDVKTSKEEGLISNKYPFDESMVLYSKIRPYLMKVAAPSFSGICSADVYPLQPKHTNITRDFLFYILLTDDFTTYAISGSSRTGMPKVNRNHLFAYKASFPSLPDQERIVARLDALSEHCTELEAAYKAKLSSLQELKQSILEKAFSGELTAEINFDEITS